MEPWVVPQRLEGAEMACRMDGGVGGAALGVEALCK